MIADTLCNMSRKLSDDCDLVKVSHKLDSKLITVKLLVEIHCDTCCRVIHSCFDHFDTADDVDTC